MRHERTALRRSVPRRCVLAAALLAAVVPLPSMPVSATGAATPYTLTLAPSQSTGIAGSPITWTASSTDPNPLVYQFSVGYARFAPLIVRDFSPKSSFTWTPQWEGPYTVTVAVKEIALALLAYGTNPVTQASAPYHVVTTVTTTAAVTATTNPLVFQYRTPSCAARHAIVAQFRQLGATAWTTTNGLACTPPLTRPFYLAGLLPNTTYQVRSVVLPVTASSPLTFTTGSVPASVDILPLSVPQAPSAQSDITSSIVAYQYSSPGNHANPVAVNLAGQPVWYATQPDLSLVWSLRVVSGTEYLVGNDGQQPQTGGLTVLRQIDLGGNVVRETNIGAVNDQLERLGVHPIYGFHHDVLPLPHGDLAVLGFTTATVTTTAILGDDIIVLDPNLRVAWAWDAFSRLDVNRGPTLGETCGEQAQYLCPVPSGALTIDWLHSNALTWSPADNNLVLSMRNQDWVIKIAYANGRGDGHVIWRLGPGGDFTLAPANPGDPFPWFSHQHNATYIDATTIGVFDNGNTRCNGAAPGTCDSRGQAYVIDEASRVVTQTLNVDLGTYSPALGVAQRLSNGNWNFDSGDQGAPPNTFGQAIEVQPNGTKVYVAQMNTPIYRAWRLRTMYAPTNPVCSSCAPEQPTGTPIATATPTRMPTQTATAIPTETSTNTPTDTATAAEPPTDTATPTATAGMQNGGFETGDFTGWPGSASACCRWR